MQFGKKNNYTHYLYSKPMIVVLLLLVLLLSRSVYERFAVERDMAQRKNEAEKELQQLQERKKQLEERVLYLEDQRGIEEEIRKNFDVAKEGEQVIILTGEEEGSTQTQDVSEPTYPWYQFWR